jgi:hypothetical protein
MEERGATRADRSDEASKMTNYHTTPAVEVALSMGGHRYSVASPRAKPVIGGS